MAKHKIETQVIHAGQKADPSTGAVMPPIYQTSTYKQEGVGQHSGYEYSRTGNPTRTALEANLAALEGSDYGLAFASGMAAIDTILRMFEPGDHILAGNDVYGGTFRLFDKEFRRYGLTFSYVDTTDLKAVEAGLRAETRLLWLETPTNPLLRISDIEALAELAHTYSEKILVGVDNTFATPYCQRPLSLGADIVVHSATKYLSGHGVIIGGLVISNQIDYMKKDIPLIMKTLGGAPSPFDAWLANLGLKTFELRLLRHCENALAVAGFLQDHPAVERVNYPGLESDPGHEIAKQQMHAFGGMVSFELRDGLQGGERLMNRLNLVTLGVSLGNVDSLIQHPASMTHVSVPPAERQKMGISDGLVRFSVGIENEADILADLEQALAG